MQTHLDAITLAEQDPKLFPEFDASKGISAWWRKLEIDGSVDALLNDDATLELAQELYAISKAAPRYQRAITRLQEAEEKEDAVTIEEAKFQAQV